MARREHPVFAVVYTALAALGERTELAARRREALAPAKGTLLVVGLGPGHDLGHVPPAVDRVVALEPEPHMRRTAGPRVRALRERGVPVVLVAGTAEQMPVADSSVDAVLCTLVLCSVGDLDASLAEVRRVLRPRGVLLVLEHVRAADGTRLASVQDRGDRLWGRFAAGCHLSRDTRAAIRLAGFDESRLTDQSMSFALPLCRPHLTGLARRPDEGTDG